VTAAIAAPLTPPRKFLRLSDRKEADGSEDPFAAEFELLGNFLLGRFPDSAAPVRLFFFASLMRGLLPGSSTFPDFQPVLALRK
jgi:hypothetical protein